MLEKSIQAIMKMRPFRRKKAIESLAESLRAPEPFTLYGAYVQTRSEDHDVEFPSGRIEFLNEHKKRWERYETPAYLRSEKHKHLVKPGLVPEPIQHRIPVTVITNEGKKVEL